jgi:ABC-2 type transport system ATP-binding protein
MLKVENVCKTYKQGNKEALKDVSFDIKRGEFLALLGPNGAGKSTMINILSGNALKDSGKVLIGGNDLDNNSLATKKIIGVVPQEISFDPFFTVNEVLKNQSGYFGIKNNQDYIDHILEKLSLVDKKHVNSKLLSGGMRRRLLIAKAMIHKPELLILDEPTAGVDIELRHSLYDFLRELYKDGVTIILTTHYLEEAEELCKRVIVINEGKLEIDENKDKLMQTLGKESTLEFHFDHEIKIDDFKFLDKYKPRLNSRGLKVSVTRNCIHKVFKNFTEQNIQYKNVVLENKKLEDVFLQLVKK